MCLERALACFVPAAKLAEQPCPSDRPVSFDSRRTHAESARCLFDRESSEKPHLDDLQLLSVELSEILEAFIERDKIEIALGGRNKRILQANREAPNDRAWRLGVHACGQPWPTPPAIWSRNASRSSNRQLKSASLFSILLIANRARGQNRPPRPVPGIQYRWVDDESLVATSSGRRSSRARPVDSWAPCRRRRNA